MKNSKLINAEVSYVVASLGHFDGLTICDAGLPIPSDVQRIDLAVTEGVPSFMDVVKTIISEMEVQEVEFAEEFKSVSPDLHRELLYFLRSVETERGKPIPVSYVSHEVFKENTRESVAVVRTGEFTPYANVTIKAGVAF
ncbi:D-ribose pyranase [Pseudodesulfovibrio nedwellii]|uniref:D-ribose pyranase n=1 Tax=Pseudodesulfovibrio nedwellii TaxID=2973072 RepID=A0ABN6S9E3_9BACT|nr:MULTISPECIES: D-ribose pyranase [Pseudodesulfovibrio]BDQ38687.1 D-ribose pyranase [Pseudodesulfovibrio nedwellii]